MIKTHRDNQILRNVLHGVSYNVPNKLDYKYKMVSKTESETIYREQEISLKSKNKLTATSGGMILTENGIFSKFIPIRTFVMFKCRVQLFNLVW